MKSIQQRMDADRQSDTPIDTPRPPDDALRARSIKRRLLHELSESHAQGRPVQPEELLARWPTDPADDRDVASLLFEDYYRREQSGECPSIADYQQRFPAQRDS